MAELKHGDVGPQAAGLAPAEPSRREALGAISRIGAVDLLGLDILTFAKFAYESGMFAGLRGIAQAVMKVQLGRDLGVSPTAALRHVYVQDGKVGLQAELMAAKIRESGRYDYEIVECTEQRCELEFYRLERGGRRRRLGTASFTMEEARRAGLVRPGSGWQKYPSDMLFARAMSRGQRRYAPDVFGQTVYERDELFEIVRAEAEEAPAQAPRRPELPASVRARLDAAPWTSGQREMWEARARREGWDEARMLAELDRELGPAAAAGAAEAAEAGALGEGTAPESEAPEAEGGAQPRLL